MITYKDISNRIEPVIIAVLALIKDIADRLGIPFFLVGAKARDLFFSELFDIKTVRASLDIDIGIRVNSWDEVSGLIEGMVSTGQFEPVNKVRSRLRHTNKTLVDIVPFGTIESPSGKV